MLPTNKNNTGLTVTTMSVEACRADGTELDQGSLGDPTVFTGNDYMLLGLQVDAPAAQDRDDAAPRRADDARRSAATAPGGEPGVPRIWCFGAGSARRLPGRGARVGGGHPRRAAGDP